MHINILILLDGKVDIITPPYRLKKEEETETQRDQVIFPKSYSEAIRETPKSDPRCIPLYTYYFLDKWTLTLPLKKYQK